MQNADEESAAFQAASSPKGGFNMIRDAQFLRIATAAFDPFVPISGTEHVAELLYSIARMLRPKSIVECGSGYTTLFLLAALKENAADVGEEVSLLRAKTEKLICGGAATDWLQTSGKACGTDPGFYLDVHSPRLYSVEKLGLNHEYPMRLTKTVAELNLSSFFTYFPGRQPSPDLLPPEAFPIDIAWNDDDQYMEFFDAFWDRLNPKGGLMIFHNTVSVKEFWTSMSCMRAKRSQAGDLEMLTLPEPHKLYQNSCTILRRMGDYRPSFETRTPVRVIEDSWRFMRPKPNNKRSP